MGSGNYKAEMVRQADWWRMVMTEIEPDVVVLRGPKRRQRADGLQAGMDALTDMVVAACAIREGE